MSASSSRSVARRASWTSSDRLRLILVDLAGESAGELVSVIGRQSRMGRVILSVAEAPPCGYPDAFYLVIIGNMSLR